MSKLFANEVVENVISIVRESMEVDMREVKRDNGEVSNEPCVIFATNRGKGTGSQVVPAKEFPDYLDRLRHYVDNGFAEAQVEGYRPAAAVVDATIGLVRPTDDEGNTIEDVPASIVQWRVREGKGAKPARVPLAQFEELIELLEGAASAIPTLAKQVEIKWEEKLAKDAATKAPSAENPETATAATDKGAKKGAKS